MEVMMRAIWTGAISFGLLNIPVKLYNAVEEHALEFTLLRRDDLCQIRHVRVCGETGEEVPYEDIVRGYEYEKGRYVVLEEEDFRWANVRKTRTMEIVQFIEPEQVDLKYLKKPYYLEPEEGAGHLYALLRQALKRSGKAGIARFVLRHREHIGMLRAEGNALVFLGMRFSTEILYPDTLALPADGGYTGEELELAVRLVDTLSAPWRPETQRNTYVEDLRRLIEKKRDGLKVGPEVEELIPATAGDLFTQLSESLQQAQSKRAR